MAFSFRLIVGKTGLASLTKTFDPAEDTLFPERVKRVKEILTIKMYPREVCFSLSPYFSTLAGRAGQSFSASAKAHSIKQMRDCS